MPRASPSRRPRRHGAKRPAGHPRGLGGDAERLRAAGLRATLDGAPEKIGKKIRDAEVQKIPVMFIIGAREAGSDSVAVRRHGKGDQGVAPVGNAIDELKTEVRERR